MKDYIYRNINSTMKHVHFTITILLLMSVTNKAVAYDFEVDGIYYNMLSFENMTCEVAPYYSEESNYSGDIVIPEKVTYNGRTLKVTRIGNYAFYYKSTSAGEKLTSVKMPNSIKTIGTRAFVRAVGLKTLSIPVNVTTIEYGAIQVCHGLTSIDIPNSVESLGNSALYNCANLVTIRLSSKLQRIEPYTFGNCSSLSNIVIPDNVTFIGHSAFYNCTALTSISIPDKVQEIEGANMGQGSEYYGNGGKLYFNEHGAFENCIQLVDVHFGNGIKKIGHKAFFGCSNLKEIIIPGSLLKTGFSVFSGCPIEKVSIHADHDSGSLSLGFCYVGEGSAINAAYVCDLFSNCPIKELLLERDIIRQDFIVNGWFYLEMKNNKGLFGNQIETISLPNTITDETIKNLSLKHLPLSRISFGKGFSVIPDLTGHDLDSLVIHNAVPPIATGFSNKTFLNCRLYVPKGAKKKYQSADVWKNFWNIIELTPIILGVESVKFDNKDTEHYGLDGRKRLEPKKGINIIKMSDGTVRKIMVK